MNEVFVIMQLAGMAVVLNILMLWVFKAITRIKEINSFSSLLNEKGEVGAEGTKEGESGKAIQFSPEQQKEVDRVVQTRLAREREKFSDYEALRNKVSEYEKHQSEKTQKELEEQKKYEEAKKGYETKLSETQKIIADREARLTDMQLSYELTNEINKQNAYAEETLALLKSSAFLKDGKIRVKGRDSSGVDVELSVEEGVKRFLETRPHLVKSNFKSGGGSNSGDGNQQSTGAEKDINTLNSDLAKAMSAGDFKKVAELKTKIRGHFVGKGVHLPR